jgi:hypothetical protein
MRALVRWSLNRAMEYPKVVRAQACFIEALENWRVGCLCQAGGSVFSSCSGLSSSTEGT